MIPQGYKLVEQDSYEIGDYVLFFNEWILSGVILSINKDKNLCYSVLDLERYEWHLASCFEKDDEYCIKGKLVKEITNE